MSKELEVTPNDLKILNKITLTKSQMMGLSLFKKKIDQSNEEGAEFVKVCLEENGGSRIDPWKWNDETMEWILQAKG